MGNENLTHRQDAISVLERLGEQRTLVAALLESTAREVRDGRAPDPRALDAATRFASELENVFAWLESQGVTLGARTVLAAIEAWNELSVRELRRSVQREALKRLYRAEVPARFDGDRAKLQAVARELSAATDWSPEQTAMVDALTNLVRICDLQAAGDPHDEMPDLDLAVRPVLPSELQRLLSLATTGRLTLPPISSPQAPPTDHEPSALIAEAAHDATTAELLSHEAEDDRQLRSEPTSSPEVQVPAEAQLLDEPEPPPESATVGELERPLEPGPGPEPQPRQAPPVEAITAPLSDADDEAAESSSDRVSTLASLLRARRYGLAAWLLRTIGEPDADVQLLRIAALGESMRLPAGAVTAAFRDIMADLGEAPKEASQPVAMVAFAAAIRATLVSPASGAADLLQELRYTVHSDDAEAIATAVHTASAKGIAYTGDAITRVRDVVELEAEVESIAEEAATTLEAARSRMLKYALATDIWRSWVNANGFLARLLRPVADNLMGESASVLQQIVELRSKGVIDKRLEQDQARMRPSMRMRLEAGARRTLLDWTDGLIDVAVRWIESVNALETARAAHGHGRWREGAEDVLRQVVNHHSDGLFRTLLTTADDASNPGSLRAAAAAASASLQETLRLLRGEALPGTEVTPEESLNAELLKVPGLVLDRELEPARPPTQAEVVAAANCVDWRAAFRSRAAEMDHEGTRAVVNIVRRDDPALAGELDAAREVARHETDGHLRAELARVGAAIESARRLGHVGDSDGLEVTNDVDNLLRRLEREEFAAVSQALPDLEARLLAARDAAQQAALARLNESISRSSDRVGRHAARIRKRIEAGDIVTADEFITQAETTGELVEPRSDADGLTPWYPAFVEQLARTPLSREAAAAIGSGDRWEGFDFSAVPANRRAVGQRAIDTWLKLRREPLGTSGAEWGALQDLLSLMGMRAEREHRVGSRAKDHQWRDIVGVRRTGNPLTPQFGSASAGMDGSRLRLLFCWSAPSPEIIVEWSRSEGGEAHTLVLLPGLLSVRHRHELVTTIRRRESKQAIVIVDDAVLLWLCMAPEPPFESLMRAVLPFTAINPYSPWSTGNVPSEMFYGRRRELEDVLRPEGTSFIFGGRQFGKSALLRRAERELSSGDDRRAVYIDVHSTEVGTRLPIEAIWEVLWAELVKHGIWTERASGHVRPERFAEAVEDWLRRHPNGRLLLLLDECDRFLEADALQTQPFATVTRLKSLRESTQGRFKPVFAGLHLVQRYQDVPNQPLAHLGEPISIGPLHPRDAFDLISEPMRALGYHFASDDLVPKVTAFCGNHPNLLQFFGEALIRRLLARSGEGPPYNVDEQEIEAVIADRELLSRFRERFVLTFDLDPRYRVVADVIAYEAARRDSTVTMRVDEIRRQAGDWWPQGFHDLQSEDAFRSVLDEMVGLGVLVPAANGYRMRTPNVLRLLGTVDEIESRLLAAAAYKLPEPFEASSHRRPLPGRELSPLTERQLGDLLKPQSRCIVLVGSAATAIDRVIEAVKQVAREARLALHTQRLRTGGPVREPESNGAHTIWLIDALSIVGPDVTRAAEKAARVSALRSVTSVLLVGAGQAEWLFDFLGADDSKLELMELCRLDSAGLRWVEHMPAYGPAAREAVLARTGGWPILIDRFKQRADEGGHSLDTIMHEIDVLLEDGAWLVDAVGLRSSPVLERVWRTLAEFDDPETPDQLAGLLEPEDVHAIEVLRMLAALDTHPDGRMACEATLRGAWQRLPRA